MWLGYSEGKLGNDRAGSGSEAEIHSLPDLKGPILVRWFLEGCVRMS